MPDPIVERLMEYFDYGTDGEFRDVIRAAFLEAAKVAREFERREDISQQTKPKAIQELIATRLEEIARG